MYVSRMILVGLMILGSFSAYAGNAEQLLGQAMRPYELQLEVQIKLEAALRRQLGDATHLLIHQAKHSPQLSHGNLQYSGTQQQLTETQDLLASIKRLNADIKRLEGERITIVLRNAQVRKFLLGGEKIRAYGIDYESLEQTKKDIAAANLPSQEHIQKDARNLDESLVAVLCAHGK